MSRSLRLRRWQKEALDLLAGQTGPDFLAVATPGAGKTTFALAAVLAACPSGGCPDRGLSQRSLSGPTGSVPSPCSEHCARRAGGASRQTVHSA
jgi:hypothetical protein